VTSDRGSSPAGTLLDEVTTIVSQAAAAILEARKGALVARAKADHSPVTAADEAAETIIMAGLARVLPGIAVVSEEATARSGPIAVGGEFALVDPIDGTRELLAGRDEFTVNVALVRDGRLVLGVVAAPALGLIWRSADGTGAERIRLPPGMAASAARDRIPIRCRPWPGEGLVATVSRSHLDQKTQDFLARLPAHRLVPSGSAIKLCRVAEGTADVYPRLGATHEWDVAAGHAVLTAAGGLVTAAAGGGLSYGNAATIFRVDGYVAWGDPAAAARLGYGITATA
jgi:3'(2'), 5'-bisphosphate nucleotidase